MEDCMNRLNKKNLTTIGFMTLFAIAIILVYYYLNTQRETARDTTGDALTEYEQIMQLDLKNNYPATSREVVKIMGRIIRYLYDSPKDEEIKPLALKIRELYDDEFLEKNPEDQYINNLQSELAQWKEKNRKITNYLMVNDDLEEETVIDGVRYSVRYISYVIREKGKFTETWKVLLKQDKQNRWKIVGWEFVPAEDKQEDEK